MKMHPVSSADRVQILADDPERPAGTGGFAGFIQNDGQIPALFAPRPAGWIGNEDLFILDAAQHNKMSGRGKMPGGHDGDDQLAAGKRVRDPLRLRCRAARDRQPPRFGCRRDECMIRTASAAPVPLRRIRSAMSCMVKVFPLPLVPRMAMLAFL